MPTLVPALPAVAPLDCLRGAAHRLGSAGWSVRWDLDDCCSVPDLRMLVDGGGPAVCVEVLAPAPDDGWWDAVRVKPANRQVWRGPQVGCPADELVWFVADLLTRDVEQLPGRYRLLG